MSAPGLNLLSIERCRLDTSGDTLSLFPEWNSGTSICQGFFTLDREKITRRRNQYSPTIRNPPSLRRFSRPLLAARIAASRFAFRGERAP